MKILEVRLPRVGLGVMEALGNWDSSLQENGNFEEFNVGG